jgi:DNA-binding CsgD family transcriptional regulator
MGALPNGDRNPPSENRTGPLRGAETTTFACPGTHMANSLAATRCRLRHLVNGSDEVHSVIPAARLGTEQLSLLHDCELTALACGARVRALFLDRAVDDPLGARFIREAAASGAAIRLLPVLPFWLTIVGQSAVMTAWNPDHLSHGALFLHGRTHVDRAREMFEHAWCTAEPLTTAPARPLRSTWERQVLMHLAMGIKDEASARQLGVSTRTYRRHVARLCERLGASSRFEAGVRAVQLGLIPSGGAAGKRQSRNGPVFGIR